MTRKKHGAEQIVVILRQIEVELANHKNIGQACKEAGITQQTYYRWRKEYGGLKLEQAKRLKELEKENGRLRRLVTELSLEKQVLTEVAEGNLKTQPVTFDSYDKAKEFLLWLIKTKPHAIDGRRLMFPPDRPFNSDDCGQLLITRVAAACLNTSEVKNSTAP